MEFLRDPISSASHILAAALAFVATLLLVRFHSGDAARRWCALIFGGCMTFVYAASGLYHALRLPPDELRPFQRLDMSAIYLMIAGSCTPLAAILLRGPFRAMLLAGEWLFAAVGIAAIWSLPKPNHAVLVATYLSMGWLGTIGMWQYWRAIGGRGVAWALAGAAFYTVGAAIELAQWPVLIPGVVRSHELLHFCDMAGSACHVVLVARFVLPYQPRAAAVIGEPAGFAAAEAVS